MLVVEGGSDIKMSSALNRIYVGLIIVAALLYKSQLCKGEGRMASSGHPLLCSGGLQRGWERRGVLSSSIPLQDPRTQLTCRQFIQDNDMFKILICTEDI